MSCERYEIVVAPSAKPNYDKFIQSDRVKRAVAALCIDPEDDPKKQRFPYPTKQPRDYLQLETVVPADLEAVLYEPGHLLIVIEGAHAIRIGYRIDRRTCFVTIAVVDPTPYLM